MIAAYTVSAVLFGLAGILATQPGTLFFVKVLLILAAVALMTSFILYADTAFQDRTGWLGANRERIAIDLVTVSIGLSSLTIVLDFVA